MTKPAPGHAPVITESALRHLVPQVVQETLRQASPSPADEFLSVHEVCKKLKLSKSSVYRLVADGMLPQPTLFGSSSRWSALEIDAVIREALAKRDAAPDRTAKVATR